MVYEESSVSKNDIASKIVFLKILSLKVTNFMGFKDTKEFSFDSQVTLIQGINGSGKSSILEALLTSIDSSARVAKIDEVVHRENGHPAQFAEITLSLLSNLGQVDIYTKITANTEENKKTRRIEKRVTIGNNTYANKQAQELLDQANLGQIAKVCFVLQNDPGLISRYELDNYKSLVSLFNIDFNDEIDSILSDLKSNASSYHDTEASYNSAKGQKSTYESIVSSKSKELEADKEAIAKSKSMITNDKEWCSKEIDKLSMSLAEVKAKIESANSNADSKIKYIKMSDGIANKIEQLQKSISDREAELQTIKASLSSMRNADEMSSLLKQFEDINTSTSESLQKAKISLAKLSVDQDNEQKRYSLISNGVCPTCYSHVDKDKLSNLSNAIDQIKQSISKANDDIAVLTSRLSKSKEGIDKFESDINTRQSLEKRAEDIAKLNDNDKAKINEQLHMKDSLDTLISTIDDSSAADLIREKNALEASLNKAKQEKQMIESIAAKESQISILNKSIEDYKQQQSEAEKSMVEAKDTLDKLAEQASIAEQAKTIFKDEIPLYALRSMCLTLERVMTEITTSIGYGPAKITTDDRYVGFLLEEKKSKEMLPIYLCSTFEQNLLQVSAKLAVALCKGYKFLCLDEVDGCATNENAMLLISSILRFAQKYQMQILIISHEPATKSFIASLDNSSIITL